jgi:23S rRNA (adenine2503-C2)-methyltransferase
MNKKNILNLSKAQLTEELKKLALPSFIANQVYDWIFAKYKTSFEEMKNVSKQNQQILKDHFELGAFVNTKKIESEDKIAIKYVFELKDGNKIESVLLRERKYNTLCISTQCGCPVDCKFCTTGYYGFKRNLKSEEIVSQLLYVLQDAGSVSRIVFMGMGEPLLNLDNVIKAIEIINNPDGFGIGKRKITVSTCGIIKGLERLINEKVVFNLALSVGSALSKKRAILMPIERQNPIQKVIVLLETYLKTHNRKLTLEYTLIKDKNDSLEDLNELINMAKFLKAKINLINYNPNPNIDLEPVTDKKVREVKEYLERNRVDVSIRFKKGQDIAAGCGQLGETI